MELRAFAERVLFATTLEEKLRPPEGITDDEPGKAIVVPQMPGRPRGLEFKVESAARNPMPGLRALEDHRERGRLLHFFANHELLATELMALVLVRFPDAPPAFRRGVLQTLRDEQEHTRWYLGRMRACGVEFGDQPVSGYFWRAVSGMESPMDYVAGLSLTFEQANLDFARHFSGCFASVGDSESAALLERIHRDEIAHVAYGLKWFRRWKNPTEGDWEAFCRQLKFPLSPQRAKGSPLNVESRRAAGFDARFIAELDVFAQSKGRTPGVYWFNPVAEGFVARGLAFTPGKHQTQLTSDLSNLPQFLGRQDDVVIVERRPSVEFLSRLKQAGLPLPEFVELGRDRKQSLESLASRKLGALRPWAWSPDSVALMTTLAGSVTGNVRPIGDSFNPGIARLYSKSWSAEFLRELVQDRECPKWVCGGELAGISVRDMESAVRAIANIRGQGHHRIVVKEALGLAGSNALRLWEPDVLETQRRWMANVFARGGVLVIEPWLERLVDFSAQLEIVGGELGLVGFTALFNDAKGQFEANSAEPGVARRIPFSVARALRDVATASEVQCWLQSVFGRLELELRKVGFGGPLGIDAFVYRDVAGAARLKPIVEINPRFTMGRLTLELMKYVAPGSHATFHLINQPRLAASGFDGFGDLSKFLAEHYPVRLEGEPRARIREGCLCLNDPECVRACMGVLEVSRESSGMLMSALKVR